MKKILILGGFPQMIDIIFTAKKMGIYTIVVDNNPESSSKRFADKSFNISTNNIDELVEICNQENVNGVFTGFEDFNIHIAQKLCERLNLPFYATKNQLEIITNKSRFKNECKKYDVPIIEQYTKEQAIKLSKYPYIVKPTDSYGSRGITVCRSQEELEQGIEKATLNSLSKTVIIERFIQSSYGTELFYTVLNGNIYLTATADRHTVRTEKTTVPLPVAEVFPSKHRDEMVNSIDKNIRKMLKGMEIKNGLILIQTLYENGEFFIYEMAYRFTGEQHYRLILNQKGVNLARFMIMLSMGEDVSEFDNELLSDNNFIYPSINLAVVLRPGKVKEICGLEKVFKIDEVISYNLNHAEGDEVASSGDYSHILIRINMVAKNYNALKRAVNEVREYITVISEAGEDMIVSPFVLED